MPVPADVMAIGHRVVHGGPDLTQPVLIDPSTMERIDAVCLSRLPVYAICTDEELVIARYTSANISIEIN